MPVSVISDRFDLVLITGSDLRLCIPPSCSANVRMSDDFEDPEQTPESFLLVSLTMELGLGGLAILFGVFWGPDPRDLIPKLTEYSEILSALFWGVIATIPMVIAVQIIERLPLKAIHDLQRATEDHLLKLMVRLRVSELGVVSMAAGVGEELLFRGWLMMALLGSIDNTDPTQIAVAIGVSSIVFGLVHPISKLYIGLTALMGIYFGVLLFWSGNLLVPIVAHALYDFVELVLTTRAMRRDKGMATP